MKPEKQAFLAGGGTTAEWERYVEIGDWYREILRKQIDRNEYFACGASGLYVIKGRTPGSW